MSSTTEKCREILLRLTKAIDTIEAYKCKNKDDNHSKDRLSTPGSSLEKKGDKQAPKGSANSSVLSLSAYNLLFRTLLEIRTKSYTKTQTTRSKLIHYNIIKKIFHLLCQQPDDLQAAYENYLIKTTGRKRSDDRQVDSEKDGNAKESRVESSCKNNAKDVNSGGWPPQPFELDEQQQMIPFEDFRDLLLSLLGNFCLDSAARSQVIKHRGITVLRSILFESESDSIWRRCCRTLANLAVDPACRKAIQATDITAKIICILESSCDSECKSTICRTLRLFADSSELVKTIIDCNGIYILIQICRYGVQSVKGAAVKTLAELGKKNCSAEYGQQVLRGEGLAKLVEMTKEDAGYSENALCILIYLSRHNFMRPLMGSSDVIHTLQTKFESEIPGHLYSEILNAFCLFSNEALNRVKLRQFGILKILLSALQDQRYASLHNRIISAFVNFLYDDSSFDLLLEYGLVPVLLVHLQRCACFSFSMPDKEPFVESLIEEVLNRQEEGMNSGSQEPECSSDQKTSSTHTETSSANIGIEASPKEDPKKGLIVKEQSSAERKTLLNKSPESTSNNNKDVSKTELKIEETAASQEPHSSAINNPPQEKGETSSSTKASSNTSFQTDDSQNSIAPDSSSNVSRPTQALKRAGQNLKRKQETENCSQLSKRYRLSLDVETDPLKEPAILSLRVPHTHNLSQLGAETVANLVDMSASTVLSHINKSSSSGCPETNTTEIIAFHDGSLLEPSSSKSEDTESNGMPISVSLRTKCSRSQIEDILKTKGFSVKPESETFEMDREDDNEDNDDEDDKVLEKQRKNIYCIDSPSYQDNITWQPEDFANDQTSKSSTIVKETTSVNAQCLSPLSNASYHSPDWSPDFNTQEKDFSSEDSYSSEEEMQVDYYRKALRHFDVEIPKNNCQASASETLCRDDDVPGNNPQGSVHESPRGSVDVPGNNSQRLVSESLHCSVDVSGNNPQGLVSETLCRDDNVPGDNPQGSVSETPRCSVDVTNDNRQGSASETSHGDICQGSSSETHNQDTDKAVNCQLSDSATCGRDLMQNDKCQGSASTTCHSEHVGIHSNYCEASTSEISHDEGVNRLSNNCQGSDSVTNRCDDDKSAKNCQGSTSETREDVVTNNTCEGSATGTNHDKTKNTSSVCTKKRSMANRTTEDNILILLSRISQKENPTKYLANVESFLCLLRYIGHVPQAFPRSVRILGRVVSNLFCLESLLGFMAPALIFLELMTSWNRRICDARCQDEMFWTPSRATWLNIGSAFSISSCIKSSDDLLKAGQLILNEFGVVAEINFGTCLLAQHLMKESPQQKYVIACLPFLCRSHNVQEKLLVRLRGFDLLQNIVMSNPQSCLSKVIMLGLSYLACHLNVKPDPIMPTPFPKCSKVKKLAKCSLKKFPKDITFVTDHGQRVFANKERLTQQSDVFSAMLSSNFLESTSAEIAIPDISLVALRFIVHYLHGCSAKCCVIEYIVSPKSSLPFDGIVNVLAHADQYMLTKLQNFLVKIVREKYLNYQTAGKFYNIASLHNYDDLRKECLTYCLVSLVFGSKSVSCMMDILTGPYAVEFLDLVKKTLKKHSTIDPFAKV